MAAISLTVEQIGKGNIITRLVNLKRELPRKAAVAITEIAEDIRDDAKIFVPVATGTLKKTIRVQRTAKPAGVTVSISVVAGGRYINPITGKIVDYAEYVERGTSKMYPRPYLEPAKNLHASRLAKVMKELIKE